MAALLVIASGQHESNIFEILESIKPVRGRMELAAAKKNGATNEMLKEMFAVVGLANKNNKLVDSYQVEVDDSYK